MKEKIGIEKLIELLNEYDPYIASDGERRDNLWGYAYQGHSAVFPKELAESYIISARYGFIKWLVENEKIEYRKIIEKEIEVGFKLVRIKDYPNKIMEEDVEELLMLLAIQDEPIEFLISILK